MVQFRSRVLKRFFVWVTHGVITSPTWWYYVKCTFPWWYGSPLVPFRSHTYSRRPLGFGTSTLSWSSFYVPHRVSFASVLGPRSPLKFRVGSAPTKCPFSVSRATKQTVCVTHKLLTMVHLLTYLLLYVSPTDRFSPLSLIPLLNVPGLGPVTLIFIFSSFLPVLTRHPLSCPRLPTLLPKFQLLDPLSFILPPILTDSSSATTNKVVTTYRLES